MKEILFYFYRFSLKKLKEEESQKKVQTKIKRNMKNFFTQKIRGGTLLPFLGECRKNAVCFFHVKVLCGVLG